MEKKEIEKQVTRVQGLKRKPPFCLKVQHIKPFRFFLSTLVGIREL